MKLNVILNDGSKLNDIRLFYSKDLNTYADTEMKNKDEFLKALEGKQTMFFSGKYIQGGFIPKQVKTYEFLNDLTIHDLQVFSPESEELATNIYERIKGCDYIKGTNVQKIGEILRIIKMYS